MDQKRKIWAIVRVLRSGEETPRSGEGPRNGEGPRSGEGSPHRSKAERKGSLGLGFAAVKPPFTAWKCCVFVSFCFSVVPKTCLLD